MLPFALAMAAGILAALYGDFSSGLLQIAGAGFFVLAAFSLWRFGGNFLSLSLVILFFVLFGAWRTNEQLSRHVRHEIARLADSSGTVDMFGRVEIPLSPGMPHPAVVIGSVRLRGDHRDVQTGSLRFRLNADLAALKSARYGDYVFARGRLRAVSETYQYSEAAVITAVTGRLAGDVRSESVHVVIRPVSGFSIRRSVESLRGYVIRTFNRYLSPDGSALCKALVLGDRGDFSADFSRQLRYTGLSHVFALSGMNVALLAGLAWYALSLFYLPRNARLWIVLAVVILYMEVGREAPSLVRASIMAALFVAGHLLYRRADIINCVAGAAFLELLWRPLDLVDAGFLLSYLAVLGLIGSTAYFQTGILKLFGSRRWALVRGIALVIAASIAAQIATLPMVAWLFHRIPLVGILGNIVAVPAFAVMLIWSILMLIANLAVPWATPLIAGSLDALSFGMGTLVNALGSMPFASMSLPPLHPISVILIYVIVGLLLVGFATSRRSLIISSLLILANLIIWPAVFSPKRPAAALTFFAVENGDATLISDRQGHHILLDAGPRFGEWSAADRILPYLASHGIDRLDAVILTHPDNDHIGGAADILGKLPVDRIFTNGDSGSTRTFLETSLTSVHRGCPMIPLAAGEVIGLSPECSLRVLYPDSLQWAINQTENQRSLVLKLECGNAAALFPADIDSLVEGQLLLLGSAIHADLLKVAHHGSKASSTGKFLSGVAPSNAVVSYGRHNRYGHPAASVVERLSNAGIEIHRTALEGTIMFETHGQHWTFVENQAQRLIRQWKLPHA